MTNLSTTYSRPDPEPEHATLEDVLRMVSRLGQEKRMGRDWRRTALALTAAAADLEHMDGLVHDGEVYNATIATEYAACKCGNARHEFRRDAPEGRGHWNFTRLDAEAQLAVAHQNRLSWYPNRPVPHLVVHLVATTTTEKIG
jgi:hypothetical protein